MHRLILLLALVLPLGAQKVNLQRNVTGTLPVANGGTAATTATGARTSLSTPYLQVGTSLPATCTVGTDLYFKTDAIAGQNLYGCTATNTWTLQSSGGSATLDPGTLTEIVKPSAPSANGLKIYALDVSGVTYLCVQNSDAAEICIAPAGITTSSTDPGAIEFKNQSTTLTAGSASGRTKMGVDSSGVLTSRTYGGSALSYNSLRNLACAVGDPAGDALSTGVLCYFVAPVACTIKSWDILVDAGTATVQVWKVASGTAIPTVGNTISTSGIAISSGTAIHSTTLTDFTSTAVAANDIIAFNLGTVATAKYIYFGLQCQP